MSKDKPTHVKEGKREGIEFRSNCSGGNCIFSGEYDVMKEKGTLKCNDCKYLQSGKYACYCLKLKHTLEHGIAMKYHSERCRE